MNTEFWTEADMDDLVERLTTHLDEQAVRSGGPDQPDGPDGDGAGALTEELRMAAVWAGPPAGLRDRILASVRAESVESAGPQAVAALTPDSAAPEPPVSPVPLASTAPATAVPALTAPDAVAPPALDAAPPATPSVPEVRPAGPGSGWLSGLRARWRRLAWAIPATAVAAALFTVGVLAVDRALQPDLPSGPVFAIVGSQLAPQARGEVRLAETPSGFSIVVDVQGLPAAAPGSYYAAWLRGPDGIVPLGSFHMRGTGTPVRLWSGVSPDRYPDLVVTLQAEGDPPAMSQLVVMTASLVG